MMPFDTIHLSLMVVSLAECAMAVWLMTNPRSLVRKRGKADIYTEPMLMIYRLCGLWLAATAILSLYAWWAPMTVISMLLKRTLLRFLILVHAVEVLIKWYGLGFGPHTYANVLACIVCAIGGLAHVEQESGIAPPTQAFEWFPHLQQDLPLSVVSLAECAMALWLLTNPRSLVRKRGKVDIYTEPMLMIYRLCGLWLAATAILSLYAWWAPMTVTSILTLLRFLMFVHAVEVLIKWYGLGFGPHTYANVLACIVCAIGGLARVEQESGIVLPSDL